MVVVSPRSQPICLFLCYCARPGQPRLDSGCLPAGWFHLPDAVGGLLGCHPSAPPISVFVDLRAALGHVDCCHVTCVLSWAIGIVTSAVRIKQLREVYDTSLLTPMKNSVSRKRCPMCWYRTDSRASRSRSSRIAKLAQREVVDFQVEKSYLPWNQLHGFTVQQARAQLCDPSGGDRVMFLISSCAGVFTRC